MVGNSLFIQFSCLVHYNCEYTDACLNGATCVQVEETSGVRCMCAKGYLGLRCERKCTNDVCIAIPRLKEFIYLDRFRNAFRFSVRYGTIARLCVLFSMYLQII